MICKRSAWPRVMFVLLASFLGVSAAGCGSGTTAAESGRLKVVAVTEYLADIAGNVSGDRLEVTSLIPEGSDSHAFEPTPQDAKLLAESRVVILDTHGLTPLVDDLIEGLANEGQLVIEAASGLTGHPAEEGQHAADSDGHEPTDVDPHFWLDPVSVITYVENIRSGFALVSPEGAATYQANAEAYVLRLKELDSWIAGEVASIPPSRRLLVTNHEEFGYFAERYGFTIVGTVIPGVSPEGAPSAQQLVALVDQIRATGAPAIFLEAGTSPDLADEVARETGVKVIDDLYTHSLGKNARSYIEMMRWDVGRIVEALR